MAGNLSQPDPELMAPMAWSRISNQLGHWNDRKVIAIPLTDFAASDSEIQAGIIASFKKATGEEGMFARDPESLGIMLLGPTKLFKPDTVVVDGNLFWDPKGIHAPAPKEQEKKVKIPRPPNAYILYRKDHHREIRDRNPGLHNNEVSVIVGNMWRDEQPHIREKYFNMAKEIKRRVLIEHPDYRYNPRRSQDIRRRVSPHLKIKLLNYDANGNLLWGTVNAEDAALIRTHFTGVVRVEEMDDGCRIVCRPVAGSRKLRAAVVDTWMPRYTVDPTPVTEEEEQAQAFNFNDPMDPFGGAYFPLNDHLWIAVGQNNPVQAPVNPNPHMDFEHPAGMEAVVANVQDMIAQVQVNDPTLANEATTTAQTIVDDTINPALIPNVNNHAAAHHHQGPGLHIPVGSIITPSASGNAVHVTTPGHTAPGYTLVNVTWPPANGENMDTED
ncbi:putative mat-a protein [Sordaria brevicollis]|uniref:Mat-a protein n=2 Tax=Sordaria brevicollis TaxID=83679 RepID=A0AAE0PA14_SORBR|nr:putative mat-a protein [Sordaria brevicollis]